MMKSWNEVMLSFTRKHALILLYFPTQIAHQLLERVIQKNANQPDNNNDLWVLDLECGVGVSTRAIATAFQQDATTNVTVVGVDTSPEILAMALAKDLESRSIRTLSHQTTNCKGNTFTIKAVVDTTFLQFSLR
jgi:trans-aconitate methyltransferase